MRMLKRESVSQGSAAVVLHRLFADDDLLVLAKMVRPLIEDSDRLRVTNVPVSRRSNVIGLDADAATNNRGSEDRSGQAGKR